MPRVLNNIIFQYKVVMRRRMFHAKRRGIEISSTNIVEAEKPNETRSSGSWLDPESRFVSSLPILQDFIKLANYYVCLCGIWQLNFESDVFNRLS